jgi:hypothetical protein
MDQRYPWSHLGIEPTEDERAIRKAYALKVKETRPDEDPVGFQALLEARDLALRECKRGQPPADSGRQDTNSDASSAEEPVLLEPAIVPSEHHEAEGLVRQFQILLEGSRVDVEPERLKVCWAAVFSARDQAPFELSGLLTSLMLMRLVEDMYLHFGMFPDMSIRPAEVKFIGKNFLMPYAPVLRALEDRFRFLERDTMLLDYLDAGQAAYLASALTLAVGRPPTAPARPAPYYEVSMIDDVYLDLVFPEDHDMQTYYRTAYWRDKHPKTGSIVGLVFPLPVALYYRLYGFAAFTALLLTGQAVGLVLSGRGLAPELHWVFLFLYILTVVPLGLLSIKRMRLEAAGRKIRRLSRKHDLATVKEKLRAWGTADWFSMWIGILALLSMQLAVTYL